jgi:hypothetical protein
METLEKKSRKKFISDVNKSNIKAYKQFIKDTGRSDITYETFSSIPEKVNTKMFEKLLTGAYTIKLPKFGILKLIKVKPIKEAKTRIDWGLFNSQNIYAPYRNSHTEGYIYKVHMYFYEKKNPVLSFFKFRLSQKHRRYLAKLIKTNELKR